MIIRQKEMEKSQSDWDLRWYPNDRRRAQKWNHETVFSSYILGFVRIKKLKGNVF